ncbi:hypothetical protein GCM10009740_01020 [Terrabacter terrae]|uniref:Uncharacterized protein n=1 Tax=Terrabacter terrae TaxID=318434 RepID=A0ABN2TRF7_9MICO
MGKGELKDARRAAETSAEAAEVARTRDARSSCAGRRLTDAPPLVINSRADRTRPASTSVRPKQRRQPHAICSAAPVGGQLPVLHTFASKGHRAAEEDVSLGTSSADQPLGVRGGRARCVSHRLGRRRTVPPLTTFNLNSPCGGTPTSKTECDYAPCCL